MNESDEKKNEIIELAEKVLTLSRNILFVNLRFMSSALNRLHHKAMDNTTFGTDGEWIYYNPIYLLKKYQSEKNHVTHVYLHMVLHCVFLHFIFDKNTINEEHWNLACDIAVEVVLDELAIDSLSLSTDMERKYAIDSLKRQVKHMTAECLYRFLSDGKIDTEEINYLKNIFKFDDHRIWHQKNDADSYSDKSDAPKEEFFTTKQVWKNIVESMQADLETFAKQQGDMAGNLMQNLIAVNREKYDYSSFLKKFSVMGEVMSVNDDEFDYIFYTYGMQIFERNMPLIEPLEYREVKRIKEFVIVIDTSGSVQGSLVQKFLQKTYNILKQEENFFKKINLHIVQCDEKVQEDAKITSQEEFDKYLSEMQLKGFGGTDFRPVFDYVNKLKDNREFTNLRGLIYFTDGFGTFPSKQPDYHTAFVFIDDNYNNFNVPVWAIKLVLQSNEI